MYIKEETDIEMVSRAVGSPSSDVDALAINCFEYCFSQGYSVIAGKSKRGNNIATVFRNKDKQFVFNTYDRDSVADAIIFATQKVIKNKDT